MASTRFHVVDGKTKRTKVYAAWNDMRARCLNPKHRDYKRYGGRGITICPEWDDFEVFAKWCSTQSITPDLSLDRADNFGSYTPENCRWATSKQQNSNKSNYNVWINFRGVRLTQADWAKRLGVSSGALYYRLKNWPLERALTESKKES